VHTPQLSLVFIHKKGNRMTYSFSYTVTVALTGASGLPYGLRLIDVLIQAGVRVYVVYSQAAQVVASQEMQLALPSNPSAAEAWFVERTGAKLGQLKVFGREAWFAPIASGSNPPDAMVVCPCSMGSLAAIALGMSDNLLERAADVMIKEKRPLIIVPRETPLSSTHLSHMLSLAQQGVVILPPSPAFYTHPKTVEDMVDFVVSRILDLLKIPHTLLPRWGDKPSSDIIQA